MIHYMTSNGVGNCWVANELRVLQREAIPFALHSLRPSGATFFDSQDVDDLAQAHRRAIEATTEQTREVFNIGTGREQSVLEGIAACEKASGRSIAYEVVPKRAGDPPRLVADPSKLIDSLGWKPDYLDIEKTIETAWAWHSSHPSGYGDE